MVTTDKLKKELYKKRDPEKAVILSRFFKTKKGEYGEGDIFLGITVPVQRKIALNYVELSLKEIKELVSSEIHEHRFSAGIILVDKYQKGNEKDKDRVFKFYLKNLKRFNNWDLIDTTAPKIIGEHLFSKDKSGLIDLARSQNLWEKRAAIVSTLYFIKKDEYDTALIVSKILLEDSHHLIHKAVGWMLREIGKRSIETEKKFLDENHKQMPSIMLSYATEKFNEKDKSKYKKHGNKNKKNKLEYTF